MASSSSTDVMATDMEVTCTGSYTTDELQTVTVQGLVIVKGVTLMVYYMLHLYRELPYWSAIGF